jgi:RNA polymerase sigma factor (sigma-70 family)
MPSTDSASELMARAQQGDRAAFDDLVRTFYRAVYSYARRSLGDEDQALEVTQATFVRAFRYRASFKPKAGGVRGWLFAIAANQIRDARKARRFEQISDMGKLSATAEDGLDVFARGALREDVSAAIDALPQEQREVIALKYLSDLSFADVAQALGISVGAAKMRALRARDTLARSLASQVLP